MADQPMHMLRYWLEDKGLERGLKEYYPELCKNDPVIKAGLEALHVAQMNLINHTNQLYYDSEEELDV